MDQHWKWGAGKSLVITLQWSNTFGPDCSLGEESEWYKHIKSYLKSDFHLLYWMFQEYEAKIIEMEARFQQEQSSKAKMQQDMDALKMFYESKLSDVGGKHHQKGKIDS